MKPNNRKSQYSQAGFSLVEIMVGLVIGLLATLVITQVFSVFEGQKRSTTGVADAQTNGSIALYTVQRELQIAGYGLLPIGDAGVPDSAIECATVNNAAAVGVGGISPAIITDGGALAGASDSITIRYGTTDTGGIPFSIKTVNIAGPNQVTVDNREGCQANDIALIVNGSTCSFTRVTSLPAAASGVDPALTLQDTTNAIALANLACLQAWNEITYRVNNGNLERCDLAAATANGGNCNLAPATNANFVPYLNGIVNIQAQYGISSAANSNRVVQWVEPTGIWAATPAVADRNRIKAIRIAIVARNGLLEKEVVTLPCTSLTANAPNGLCAWSATSLSPSIASPAPQILLSNDADGTSWQRYRYRVFETVVPLRNMIWSRGTL